MSQKTTKSSKKSAALSPPKDYLLNGFFIPGGPVDEGALSFELVMEGIDQSPDNPNQGAYSPTHNVFWFFLRELDLEAVTSATLIIREAVVPNQPKVLEERVISGPDFALYAEQKSTLVVDLSSLKKIRGKITIQRGGATLPGYAAGFSLLAEYQRLDPTASDVYITETRNTLVSSEEKFIVESATFLKLNPENRLVRLILRDRSGNLIGEKSLTITEQFDYSQEQSLSFTLPETRVFIPNPADKRPPRFRGRVVDENGQVLLLNTQLIVFDALSASERTPVVVTNTNGNGDFSVPYPMYDFSGPDTAVALLGGSEPIAVKIKLVPVPNYQYDADGNLIKDASGNPMATTLYRLPEFSYLIVSLHAHSGDCDCPDENDCQCNKKTLQRIAEHSDLIGNADFGQDLGDGCVNFTTPNRTLEEFSYYAIVRTTEPDVVSTDVENLPAGLTDNNATPIFPKRRELNDHSFVDWDLTPVVSQAVTIAHGHILHYKQKYFADGYSMGDLLYSLPLAPGQKKQIAVFDWDRQETAARRESQVLTEDLEAILSRDRDISEVVRGTLRENMRGGSSASVEATSGGGGFALFGSFFGIGGGVSSSSSNASSSAFQNSSREASSLMNNRLRDTTMQSASSLRSLRASVVSTVNQGENLQVTTETVANYNHCHAITIQYFEVLRHIAIKQELVDVQECLFVPLLMTRFDENKVMRWREHLEKSLLATGTRGSQLRRAFEAIRRKNTANGYQNFPAQRFADEPILSLSGEIVLQLTIKRPEEQVAEEKEALKNQILSRFGFLAVLLPGLEKTVEKMVNKTAQEKERIFDAEVAPVIARELVSRLQFITSNGVNLNLDCTLLSRYQKGGLHRISIRPSGSTPVNVPRVAINTLQIVTQPQVQEADYLAIAERGFLSYATEHYSGMLFNSSNIRNDLTNTDGVVISTRPNADEMRNPQNEDSELATILLQHLNEHLEHYHNAIWYHMSPSRRFALLEGIKMPNNSSVPKSVRGKSVASVVENNLLAVIGNSLVFPVAAGYNADPVFYIPKPGVEPDAGENRITINGYSLLEHYAPLTPVDPFRVSLPTKGVFAEAVQGSCNSCEKIDDTRYWRWEESPIPDSPTAIQPVSTDTRRQDPVSTDPTPLPNPVINIQNAPTAPDPTGMAALLNLLGQKGLFENITGLNENQKNALQGLVETQKGAQSFANTALDLARLGHNAKNADKVSEQINDAVKSGRISQEEGSELTKQLLKSQIGTSSAETSKAKLTDTPEVKEGIKSFVGSDKGSLLVGSDGSLTVTKDVAEGRPTTSGSSGAMEKISFFVPTVQQPTDNTCWAAALTMLYSWKTSQSIEILDVVQKAGFPYDEKFLNNEGLPKAEKAELLNRMGLVSEPPMSYSLAGLTRLLKNHGPIWLTLDADSSESFSAHAVVIYGIDGPGHPDKTVVHFIDPDPLVGDTSMTFSELMRRYEELASLEFVQVVHYPDVVRADLNKTPSGAAWVEQFQGSNRVEDLSDSFTTGGKTVNFRQNVQEFIRALEQAGISAGTSGAKYYRITSTLRPKERAYMMHWAWRIVKQDLDPRSVPDFPGVDIQWWHGNLPDSVAGAKEMVEGFGLTNLKTAPALQSHHTRGLAIDMQVIWSGPIKIKKKDGTEVNIGTAPRDNTNAELIEVAKTFGVIHFINVDNDKVHWSVDGR